MNVSCRAIGATLLAAAAVSLPFAPMAFADTTGWAPTATQALSLQNATDLGPLSPSAPLRITLGLRLQNQAALNTYIEAISTPGNPIYGQSLTPDTFTAVYGPTSDQVQAVTSYLASAGFNDIQVSPNHLVVSATGTAAQVERAFHTTLEQFQVAGQTVYYNTTGAYVPSSLSATVGAVLGLNNVVAVTFPLAKPSDGGASSSTGGSISLPNYPTSYNPQGFQTAYDVGKTATGQATSIAIFAEGDLTGVLQDLRTEEQANGLPQVPVTVVQTGIASTDTSGADEWDLDTQYSTGMAETVKRLYLYDATSLTDSDIALEFNRFVTDDVAKAGSASFGEDETFAYLDGSMLVDDEVFAEAAAQGQTVFASSGDTGGFSSVILPTNGVPAGVPDVEYPAASPYVVAVGGTTLLTNSDGSYNEELAWLAGGGGPSYWETSPYWQSAVVPEGTVGRALPDISMDADPNSGANVYVNGSVMVVGGTSLASPLALGVWARLESAHGNHLGFASPLLYAQYGSAGFHDIVLGDNGPYPATPGWDFATGLGTFDVSQMNAVIGK
ncbi:MAG: S53 family peptidase [Alicyclobacillus sp.]|nr:S53 family peptidase [Alicyclobacillus sp.]